MRNRKRIRLAHYDYTDPGGYFVTLCTQDRECLFGEIKDGVMKLNEYGKIAADEWSKTALIRPGIQLDEWVIMPNHIHGIIMIDSVGATRRVAPTETNQTIPASGVRPAGLGSGSVGAILGQIKSVVTKRINMIHPARSRTVWQRNYFEHVIRNDRELERIREYIRNNPLQWELDSDNPATGLRDSPIDRPWEDDDSTEPTHNQPPT